MRGQIGRCDEPSQGVVTRGPAAIRAPERAFGARATGQTSKGPIGRMASKQELSSFIRSTFSSIWSLELLLFLKTHRDRSWSPAEMVASLRGSDLLVARSAQPETLVEPLRRTVESLDPDRIPRLRQAP